MTILPKALATNRNFHGQKCEGENSGNDKVLLLSPGISTNRTVHFITSRPLLIVIHLQQGPFRRYYPMILFIEAEITKQNKNMRARHFQNNLEDFCIRIIPLIDVKFDLQNGT